MNVRVCAVLLGMGVGVGAFGQVFVVTDQERFVRGSSITTFEDGSTFDSGTLEMEPPAGMFYPMPLDVSAASPLFNVHAMQEGGWDGGEFIRLNAFIMNYSGGGGPNTTGSGTLINSFGYTFVVTEPAEYTLDYSIGGSPPVEVRLQIDGPSLQIDESSLNAPNNLIEARGLAGRLDPGVYTLLIRGEGTIGFTGPGGNGGGAGGNPPIFEMRIIPAPPPPCGTADFDGDGDVGTDADIEAFFTCLAGFCCPTCWHLGADFDGDGDVGTDADIESFFRVLAGGLC